ncbi:FAD-dependent oxidoreductase [Alkalicoccus chagannorensis]|uniref:FAD-dependent oxidoreductase n=1 Tax=Alkalicoccus chagannorensis TaxID=427072 RepID=UPI0004154065|nr:FAD-dependent oxidoreductase [Alkalicoccus chagannorensis]
MKNRGMLLLIPALLLVLGAGYLSWDSVNDHNEQVRQQQEEEQAAQDEAANNDTGETEEDAEGELGEEVEDPDQLGDLSENEELFAIMDDIERGDENPQIEDHYETVVIGGDPEGVSAAVSAARNGTDVLFVEERDGLGGLYTYGMLNYLDIVYGKDGEHAIGGIFEEWHHMVGRQDAFDIDLGKAAFLYLVEQEDNITLLLETDVTDLEVDESSALSGITVNNEHGEQQVSGDRFIDATQDADIAAEAGAPYYMGAEDMNIEGRLMAVTLMIRLSDVDWEAVGEVAADDRFGPSGINDTVAWGFTDIHTMYEAQEEDTRLRGLNVNRVMNEDGEEEFFINALQLFGVDATDEEQVEAAVDRGQRETDHVVEFLREEFPGFEEAEIIDYPEELYVRESRHVESEYMLPMSDVWTNADHWDSVGYGGYEVDVQATSLDDWGFILSAPEQYAIPFRSLVPQEVDNLLVASKAAGFTSNAAGSARIVPTTMAAAEGAGAAAAVSLEEEMTFREMTENEEVIEDMRERLLDQGAFVEPFDLDYPYEGEYYDEAIQFMLNYALVSAGYDNDLYVDEELAAESFISIMYNGYVRFHGAESEEAEHWFPHHNTAIEGLEGSFTAEELASYTAQMLHGLDGGADNAWDELVQQGYVDEHIHEELDADDVINAGEGYYIIASILQASSTDDLAQPQ